MGFSTDAHLAFGIDLGEELPEFLEQYDDDEDDSPWSVFLGVQSGLPKYGAPGYDYQNNMKFEKEFPIALIEHCSGDYPMYILAVNGTEQRASRGYPLEIADLNVTLTQKADLESFLQTYGIEGTPKWLLFSSMD